MIKGWIKRAARSMGIEILRYVPHNSIHAASRSLLTHLEIGLVFDIGANTGQYGEDLFETGYKGRIVSFEPLMRAHASLQRRAAHYPDWLVHERVAVGATTGQVEIQVAGNSVSSSILPMLKRHTDACPESAGIGKELVPIVRLDDVADAYWNGDSAALLKVDTQGFEWEVLEGALASLERIDAVQLELSLVPLYEGQHLWRSLVDRMESLGFLLYFVYPAFSDNKTGQMLQWDAMFVRKEHRVRRN